MIVNDVELGHPLDELAKKHDMMPHRVLNSGVGSQRSRAAGYDFGRCLRVAAGEQHHVVTVSHELFGQPADDAFGSSVILGRDRFVEWYELCDSHRPSSGAAPAALAESWLLFL